VNKRRGTGDRGQGTGDSGERKKPFKVYNKDYRYKCVSGEDGTELEFRLPQLRCNRRE
jgi:hypothetical protein